MGPDVEHYHSYNCQCAVCRSRLPKPCAVAWMGEYNINDIRDHYTVVMRNKTDFSSMPDRIRPLYTHPQPAIPEGWQLVPVEPTPEMVGSEANRDMLATIYKAMLTAAPKPENSHD